MTGAPVWALWATNFIWDMGTYLMTVILIIIAFMTLDPRGYFTVGDAPGNVAASISGPHHDMIYNIHSSLRTSIFPQIML